MTVPPIWCCNPNATSDSVWESARSCTKAQRPDRCHHWEKEMKTWTLSHSAVATNSSLNEQQCLSYGYISVWIVVAFLSYGRRCSLNWYSIVSKVNYSEINHFRQSLVVCPCPLRSCLCAPQTDCWARPCTAGGGHRVPHPMASHSSPPVSVAQLQGGHKVK